MKKQLKLRVVIEPDEDRFYGGCPDLPGCHTWGYTRKQTGKYLRDAVELYLEDMIEDGEALPSVGKVESMDEIELLLVVGGDASDE